MVTSISRPTSHVFLGRGRQSEGCIQRKEQSDYDVGDSNTGKKSSGGICLPLQSQIASQILQRTSQPSHSHGDSPRKSEQDWAVGGLDYVILAGE